MAYHDGAATGGGYAKALFNGLLHCRAIGFVVNEYVALAYVHVQVVCDLGGSCFRRCTGIDKMNPLVAAKSKDDFHYPRVGGDL